MEVRRILETVAGRWAIEEYFHDTKEICGAGKQQDRNIWSNIACWNLNGWLYTMVELESWESKTEDLVDRSARPWDNPDRRPSHSDRRRTIVKKMLEKRFYRVLENVHRSEKIRELMNDLQTLAA